MSDWTALARDIRPGDRYRNLGPGFRARTVLSVASMCNCQNPYGGGVIPASQPAPPCPPGHNAHYRGSTAWAEHHAIMVVTTVDLIAGIPPHWRVTLTDSAW